MSPWLSSYLTSNMAMCGCTSGCNYSLCAPDNVCGRRPKHVEWPGSKINKDCLELHLFGLLNKYHAITVCCLLLDHTYSNFPQNKSHLKIRICNVTENIGNGVRLWIQKFPSAYVCSESRWTYRTYQIAWK